MGARDVATEDTRKTVRARLARIEGQVRGIGRMVDEDRYCIDVITQVQAIKAALGKVEELILADHVDTCVEHALADGDLEERRAKVDELLKVLPRMGKRG